MRKTVTDSEILLSLADRLPEKLLREWFPDIESEGIRETLRRLGAPTGRKTSGTAADLPDTDALPPGLKPGGGRCILYTDGASRGNPGEAGAGMVLLDARRRELAARSRYLGQCTNNAAEYRALIAGLEMALETGCRELDIMMDSELIVRQLTGRYKVKNPQLLPLYHQVRDLLARFDDWLVAHVPRAENARADQLANQGIDERT